MRRDQNENSLILQTAILTALVSSAVHAQTTPVGPVTATITQLNYDQSGGVVNGFLIGTNVLLTFRQPVCGGIGTLGNVGDSVTYSGSAHTFTSGFQIVAVTSYTDGANTYPPAQVFTRPSAYPLTAGTITQLNYDPENGAINGFVLTPQGSWPIPTLVANSTARALPSGQAVFVDIGYANATLTPLLTVGASVSVAGTLSGAVACTPAGTIPEVYAHSLTIGSTVYRLPNF